MKPNLPLALATGAALAVLFPIARGQETPASIEFSVRFEVDYVRVFQKIKTP